jgi:N-terminal domain on NACHT_NTPase and P-loop NTPases
MIDPLAALGLAGNIVQFVDFSYNLLCESKALYDSRTGATADNVLIETIATDLSLLNARLTAPSAPGAIPDPIRSLASQCKDVARDLLDVIDNIKVKGSHKRWKSFIQALRTVWKKEEIEALVRRMESLRSEMQFRLQIMMR